MKWQNLKDNKCPKCSEKLNITEKPADGLITCSACEFRISHTKYLDIKTDMAIKGLE